MEKLHWPTEILITHLLFVQTSWLAKALLPYHHNGPILVLADLQPARYPSLRTKPSEMLLLLILQLLL